MTRPPALALILSVSLAVRAAAALGAEGPPPSPEGALVLFRGATLVDPRSGGTIPDAAVLVKGERIAAAGPAALVVAPPGARVVDVSGLYLSPGLIDSHVHLATPPDRAAAEAVLRKDLFGGITAVRDMADDLRQVGDLSRAALVGEIAAPDIDMAALFAGPAFFKDPRTKAAALGLTPGEAPFMRAVTAELDLDEAMAEAKGSGARAAKIYADLSGEEVKALTAAAHRRGLLVFAHAAVFPARPSEVVAAGVDSVSHVCMLGYEVSARPPSAYHDRAPVDAALLAGATPPALKAVFQEMRRRGVVLDATLRVYRELDAAHAAHPSGPAPYCNLALAARLAGAARDAGVLLSAGTDGVSPPGDPWPALQDELELLQERAGLTPLEALRAATLGGARALGREGEMGAVEPGKRADMVFTTADPLKGASAFRTVTLTVKRGRLYWRGARAISGAGVGK